jgi:hypothetical protein
VERVRLSTPYALFSAKNYADAHNVTVVWEGHKAGRDTG